MFRLFGAAGNACGPTLGAKTNASPWMCLRTLSSQTPPRTRRKWGTKEEESLIGLRSSGMTNNQISIELGRSFISVKGCVRRLRRTGAISYTPRKGLAAASFTPQEDSRLLTATQGFRNWDHITKLFPGRSTKSLQARCTLLSRNECRDAPHRHGRYSEEDDARLLYCYHRETLSIHQIAALLSRGYNSVQARFQALRNVHIDDKSPLVKAAATEFKELKRSGNLPKGFYGTGGACRRWTPQEISQCLDMAAAGIDRGEIASMLHRTRYAVYKMLKRGRPSAVPPGRSRRWTEEEKSKLLALHASGMTSVEIAQQLSRSKGSIDRMMTGCNMIRTMQVKLGKVESGPVES